MNATQQQTSKIKASLKQLLPAYIISFVFCFMLFIYEPLLMYSTNKDDFWFDFGIMIVPTLKIFAMFFIGTAAVFTGLYFLSRKFSKEEKLYRVVIVLFFAVFIALYIQGNYLAGHLPALDGEAINWRAYSGDDIITLIVWAVLTVVLTFTVMKFGLERLVKYAAWVSLAVFVMLSVSLITTASKNDIFLRKNNFISSAEGLNGVSEEKNFFIFVVDSENAMEFSEIISDKEFDHAFDDFTYYPDTLSAFAYTRDSLPYILSGHLNLNEEEFGDYSTNALNDSMLFKELEHRDYDMYVYSDEIVWYGNKSLMVKNNIKSKLRFGEFFAEEMRYVWFKYLPYAFKKASGIENMDFYRTTEMFDWHNDELYEDFIDVSRIEKSNGAQFRLIHAEGAHPGFDMDENLNRIEKGTYLQKATATAKLIRAFIERLKQAGVYDNSAIVIMGDHSFHSAENLPENYVLARFNPILLVKGFDERHDFVISDKPVSYLDLPQAYIDLLDGKQSAELFPEAEYPRTRTVIWYRLYKEDHKEEYRTDGKATEWDKFVRTGRIYDL